MIEHQHDFHWIPPEAPPVFNNGRFWMLDEDGFPPSGGNGRIAVVGLPDTGQVAVCNSLWGWNAVSDSAEMVRSFGLFMLVNLPLSPYDAATALHRLEAAELIVYLVDIRDGLKQDDFAWIARLRALDSALVVAVVNADNLANRDAQLAQLQQQLAQPVVGIAAGDALSVRERLVPALLKACPDIAVPLATEVEGLRGTVARSVVTRSAMQGVSISIDPLRDVSALLSMQLHMVENIAAIYGRKRRGHSRKNVVWALLLRMLMQQADTLAAQFPQAKTWMASGLAAMLTTLLVGQMAILYYGARLPLPRWLRRQHAG